MELLYKEYLRGIKLLCMIEQANIHVHVNTLFTFLGCPANEATTDEAALTPQKIAKAEGYKDAMKELKKLTTFQDKADRGVKPKGFSEPWAVKVSRKLASCICSLLDLYRFPPSGARSDDPYLLLVVVTTFTLQSIDTCVLSFPLLDSFTTGFK